MGLVGYGLPFFHSATKVAPAHPMGERVLLRPMEIASTTGGGLHIPDAAKQRTYAGVLLAVGDQAADKLYDVDFRLGDTVFHGQFAGVIQAWQRIVQAGDDPACKHDSVWEVVPKGNVFGGEDSRWKTVDRRDADCEMHACRACGALRFSESVIGLMVDDIICNPDAQARLEAGITRRVRGETSDGRTRYAIVRESGYVDTFETRPVITHDGTILRSATDSTAANGTSIIIERTA